MVWLSLLRDAAVALSQDVLFSNAADGFLRAVVAPEVHYDKTDVGRHAVLDIWPGAFFGLLLLRDLLESAHPTVFDEPLILIGPQSCVRFPVVHLHGCDS